MAYSVRHMAGRGLLSDHLFWVMQHNVLLTHPFNLNVLYVGVIYEDTFTCDF